LRPVLALASAAAIAGAVALILSGGRALAPDAPVSAARASAPALPIVEAVPAQPARPPVFARRVAPGVAPPPVDPAKLVRAAPRAPLSALGLALPPRPKVDAWDGTVLYRPVVAASARFEAMGRVVAIAGVRGVEPSDTCEHDGRTWRCGVRARTAFRAFLRGRAPSCRLRPDDGLRPIVAPCRLGRQDAGLWLVSHGWARAQPGGPYVEAERKARARKLGIFGPPPPTIN
jgi:endonuclease YncB( thermonuclease family)